MLKGRKGHELTEASLQEVGSVLGISRARVQQIEKAALLKLKKALEEEGLTLQDLFDQY